MLMEFCLITIITRHLLMNAIENGVENVVILNGKLEHSVILELFTVEGAGTLIKKDENLES